MITFKQFLIESQNYPLFHGTHYMGLLDILQSNKLIARGVDGQYHPQLKNKRTISTTRSRNFATYWSQRASWYEGDNDPQAIVFQLNRAAIRNNYKVVPYNHFFVDGTRRKDSDRWGPSGSGSYKYLDRNQYEERIIGDITNISRYINKIHMSRQIADRLRDTQPKIYDKIVENNWLQII